MMRSPGTEILKAVVGRVLRWRCLSASAHRALGALTLSALIWAGLLNGLDPAMASQSAARAARTLDGAVTARLHLVKPNWSMLIEQGPVNGALSGSASAEVHAGAVFRGIFTIHTKRGSITGKGTATPHGSGRYQSFSGSFLVTGGSGRYTHISGHSNLYGVFDRRTDSVVIQTTGRFTY
jgi:hypothetical protein